MSSTNNSYVSSESSALGRMVQEAEIQRIAHNKVRDEAKQIRSHEMERIRREQEAEERNSSSSRSYYSSSRPPTSRLHSRRDSDHSSDCGGQGVRELRSQIADLETKLKTTMVTSAQLDNEKQTLRYEVDLHKDHLEELKDTHTILLKQFTEQKKDCSYQRMQIAELQSRVEWQQHQLAARDQLIAEQGLVVMGGSGAVGTPAAATVNGLVNGVDDHNSPLPAAAAASLTLMSSTTARQLDTLPQGDLETRICLLFSERASLLARVSQLESPFSQQSSTSSSPSSAQESASSTKQTTARDRRSHDSCDGSVNGRENKSNLKDYKDKLQEAHDKISYLEKEITSYKDKLLRMESQAKRNQTATESFERQEEELKQEKRKLQRELRDLQNQLEDQKSENSLLQRRLGVKKSSYL